MWNTDPADCRGEHPDMCAHCASTLVGNLDVLASLIQAEQMGPDEVAELLGGTAKRIARVAGLPDREWSYGGT